MDSAPFWRWFANRQLRQLLKLLAQPDGARRTKGLAAWFDRWWPRLRAWLDSDRASRPSASGWRWTRAAVGDLRWPMAVDRALQGDRREAEACLRGPPVWGVGVTAEF